MDVMSVMLTSNEQSVLNDGVRRALAAFYEEHGAQLGFVRAALDRVPETDEALVKRAVWVMATLTTAELRGRAGPMAEVFHNEMRVELDSLLYGGYSAFEEPVTEFGARAVVKFNTLF